MKDIMLNFLSTRLVLAAAVVLVLSGCAKPVTTDYSLYRQSRPKSILVLPPVNKTPDMLAGPGMLSQMSFPLAEAGYYVFPVAVVSEMFKNNGLSNPSDIHAVAPAKLREIFGADAALYVEVTRYGAVYAVLSSNVIVSAEAKLVDLKTSQILWSGKATASSAEAEDSGGSQGGLGGLLVKAVVSQILNNVTDRSYQIAGMTSIRLLMAGQNNGVLYGPRSPNYGKDGAVSP